MEIRLTAVMKPRQNNQADMENQSVMYFITIEQQELGQNTKNKTETKKKHKR